MSANDNYGGYLQVDDEPFEPERINRKKILIDTGTNIAGATVYPGKWAFATTTSGGLTIDTLYIRNAANSAWLAVITNSSTSTITGFVLDASLNTISALPTGAFNANVVTAAKLTGVFHKVGYSNPHTADVSISSTTYADIPTTSVTVNITAYGSKKGLLSKFFCQYKMSASSNNLTLAITDGSNVVKAENRGDDEQSGTDRYHCLVVCAAEVGSTGSGSTTRKVRAKVNAGTATLFYLDPSGPRLYLVEVL